MKGVMGTIIQGHPTDMRVFLGNVHQSTPVTNLLDNSTDARYVRFLPQTWYRHMGMRAEIVGCDATCSDPLGMESGAIPDDSITASSHYGTNTEPYRGRLNGVAGVGGWRGGWTYNFNIGQWLQVDLGEMKRVTGTIIQGRHTTFNGPNFVFPGNVDKDTPVTNLLNNPVDTRYVRFVVQSYQQDVAMRAEILGCNITAVLLPACPRMLGVESGAIPDGSITASTLHSPGADYSPYYGRLNGVAGGGAWVPTPRSVVGLWLQVFPGNLHMNSPVTNLLNNSVDARYVRFVVLTWIQSAAMRVEIVGCNTTAVLPPDCLYMLGMESGAIPDESITASSSINGKPYNGRLNGVAGAFFPAISIIGQWLQVFPGPVYMNSPVTNLLNKSVDARYVRFVIQGWSGAQAMRAEIVGCNTTAVIPVCPHMFGMESGAISNESITTSSFHGVGSEPYRGRLNGVAGVGAWKAMDNIIGEWFQVDLGEMMGVMGTIIQGHPTDDMRVTSYKLQYSEDRITWTTYAGSDGSEMVFPGNVDRSTPVTNLLDNSTDARYVRFLPQTWYRAIAMRAEIVGCYATCSDPLGMESGTIPDGSITASSFQSVGTEPYIGRLNSLRGFGTWLSKYRTIGEWLQVDLGELKRVMGTIIQSRATYASWVTSFKLQYSTDRITWTTCAGSDGSEIVFPGNAERNTPVTNLLNYPVDARYVRFLPQTWTGDIAMRVEIVGCNSSRL
ncbi:uncharacterized protein [Branchiostoma lanceolatum]|uniref:uncharacterized protein n=1 Tax=Branchiostoma lanceolatum TaxID=7740 RepID=UPI00345217E0